MEALFALSTSFDLLYKTGRDDDFVDRLNHWYSSMVFVIMAIFISTKQYFDDAISCWVPNEFSGAWLQYVENYCWIQNTYFIPHDVELSKPNSFRKESQLSYYQWVPYVLALQALMFYFPRLVWRLFNWQSGINVQEVIKKAMDVCTQIETNPEPEEDEKEDKKDEKVAKVPEDGESEKVDENEKSDLLKTPVKETKTESNKEKEKSKEKGPNVPAEIKNIAHQLEITIDSVSDSKGNVIKSFFQLLVCSQGSRKYGCYLLPLYFITKLLYIFNVVGQLFLLNSFIGTTYKFFGFQILDDLIKGNDWKSTGHFPRITMCDFEIRNVGQRTNYTVQCVLPINLFNEKIYIFIWFWIFAVAIITIYSFFQWIFRMLSFQKVKFIRNLLQKRVTNWILKDDDDLDSFVNYRLKTDGVFLIYLVYLNAGDLVTKELLEELWFRYKQKLPKKGVSNDTNYAGIDKFL